MSRRGFLERWWLDRFVLSVGTLALLLAGCSDSGGESSGDAHTPAPQSAEPTDLGVELLEGEDIDLPLGWDLVGRWEGLSEEKSRTVDGVEVDQDELVDVPVSFEIGEVCGADLEDLGFDAWHLPEVIPDEWCEFTISFEATGPAHLDVLDDPWTWRIVERYPCDVGDDFYEVVTEGGLSVPGQRDASGTGERPAVLFVGFWDSVTFPTGCSIHGLRDIESVAVADLFYVD